MKTQCCVCHRIYEKGEWTRRKSTLSPASHTYCPECLEEVRRSLDSEAHALQRANSVAF